MQTVSVLDLTGFLGEFFQLNHYPADEQGGIFRPSARPIRRIGLAIEPWPDMNNWLIRHQPDALWIHRPWKLDIDALPEGLGVLYHHLPFDEHLTMGFSGPMAEVFGLEALEKIGYKQAPGLPPRPIGMIGLAAERAVSEWINLVNNEFGGYDSASEGGQPLISRVAVVGAMNDALVREAAGRGVQLYLTGQYRPSANRAVTDTGMSVIAVGHGRSEAWGLRTLARILQERWPDLVVIMPE